MCMQLINRTINVRTKIEKDKNVVLFASSAFIQIYEKCNQKM